jgi:hypothetical protein
MSKPMWFKSIVIVAVLCMVSAGAAQAEQQGDKGQQPQPKPPADSVLVEAYLVEVSNASLEASGTDLLPDDSRKAVSITKLLWCMKDPNNSRVADSARVICRANDAAKSAITKTVYVKRIATQVSDTGHPIESVTYQAYDVQSQIDVVSRIHEDNSIGIELKFRYEGLADGTDDEAAQSPPAKLAYSFESMILLRPNQPLIVGGMQNEDTSLFLVARAEIIK